MPSCKIGEPQVLHIRHAAESNPFFRTVLWTGAQMQLTLMSVPVHDSIGAEMHADVDQVLGIASGCAKVYTGCCPNGLRETGTAKENDLILIPSGTWHNIVNVGNVPLKLFSLYAPPQHPRGTLHKTKADAHK